MLVADIFLYDYYVRAPNLLLGMFVLPSMIFAFAVVHAAALQCCGHARPFRLPLAIAAAFSAGARYWLSPRATTVRPSLRRTWVPCRCCA
jgi:hypothetical protein